MKKSCLFIAAMCCAFMANANELQTLERISVCDSALMTYVSGIKLKGTYSYDKQGRDTLYIAYTWNTDKWVPASKETKVYSATGKQLSDNFFSWDKTAEEWVPSSREVETYDANDNITSMSYFYWNSTKKILEVGEKYEYYYDEKGQLANEFFYTGSDNVLTPSYKYVYFWNSDGQLIEKVAYKWTSGSWVESMKNTYSYKDGKEWRVVTSSWNSSKSVWVDAKKIEREYNDNGDAKTETTWEYQSSEWVYTVRQTYNYDDKNRSLGRNEDHYNTSTSKWEPYYKSERTLDSKGLATSIIESYMTSGAWEGYRKYDYTYDEYNKTKHADVYRWDSGTTDWTLNYSLDYFYHRMNVGFDQIASEKKNLETQKVIRNGQLLIIRNNEVYSVSGARIQ